jgi:MFS family permease
MIAFDNLSVTFGQLASYALGAGFTELPHGWRYLVAIGGIPPIILACLMPFCPESPRQLISHGSLESAKEVLARVYPNATPEQVELKLREIEISVEIESAVVQSKSLWFRFKQLHVKPSNLRALICACAVMASTSSNLLCPPTQVGISANDIVTLNSFPAWWFQHVDVLFRNSFRTRWLRQAGRRFHRRWGNKLPVHDGQSVHY